MDGDQKLMRVHNHRSKKKGPVGSAVVGGSWEGIGGSVVDRCMAEQGMAVLVAEGTFLAEGMEDTIQIPVELVKSTSLEEGRMGRGVDAAVVEMPQ
jgi:hypothetical protein